MAKEIIKKSTEKELSQIDFLAVQSIVGNEMLESFGFDNPDKMLEIAGRLFVGHGFEGLKWYEWLIESNAVINNAVQVRLLSTLQTEYAFCAGGEDAKDLEALELIQHVFSKVLNINALFQDLLDALAKGFAVVETNWEQRDIGFIPVQANFKNQNHFRFFADGIRWIDKSGGDTIAGTKIPQDKFIVHQHLATSENPYGLSILGVRCLWLAKVMVETLKQQQRYLDGYGLPFTIVILPKELYKEPTEVDMAKKILSNSSKLRGAVVKEGTVFELSQPSTTNGQIFIDSLQYCESQITKSILGQYTTLDNAATGSYAKSKVSQQISDALIRADCIELAETVNKFIRIICDFNFEGINYPYIKFKTEYEEDTEKRINSIQKVYNMGLPIPKKNLYDMLNLTIADKDELLEKSAAQPAVPSVLKKSTQTQGMLNFKKQTNQHLDSANKKLDGYIDSSIIILPNLFKPIYTEILNYAKTLSGKDLDKLKSFTPNAELENKYAQKLNDYFGSVYLHGAETANAGVYNFSKSVSNYHAERLLEPMPYEEAIEYYSGRVPYTAEFMLDKSNLFKAKSFWMSKVNSQHAIDRIYNELREAFKEGLSPVDFIGNNWELFDNLGFINTETGKSSYLNMVYRTNFSTCYQGGSWKQMQDSAIKEVMKYGQYICVADERTRLNHLAYSEQVFKMDDPIVNVIFPPNGYQCRCSWIWLSKSQMEIYNLAPNRQGAKIPLVDGEGAAIKGTTAQPDKDWRSNQAAAWLTTNK